MASDKYSGIVKVEYAPALATPFSQSGDIIVLGDCASDSEGLKTDVKSVETSAGTALYAGKIETFAAKVFDQTKYAALETLMKADAKIDIRITTSDNTTPIVIITNSGVIVSKNYGMKVGDRNYFELKAQGYSI